MKKLPDMDIQLGPVYEIMNGRTKTQIFLSAIELKVFDYLSSPKACGEIAEELKTHKENTGFLLDGLTAMGLLEKENGLYRNSPETQLSLYSESPAYVGQLFVMMDQMAKTDEKGFLQLVKEGPQAMNFDMGAEEIWAGYARAMANFQRSGVAQKMALIVSGLDGFAGFKKMLDLGGGPGLFCIAMVDEHPSMHGVIFDQPAVVKISGEFIEEYQMQDRITVMGGDYMKDSLGEGYDLIWASSTLNFARENLVDFFQKIHKALAPGGVFISLAEGMTHEATQPSSLILGSVVHMLMGNFLPFNKGEIAKAMHQAGFSTVERKTVETSMVPMELDIAIKLGK